MTQPMFEAAGTQGAQAVVQITLGQVYNEVRQTHEAVQALVSSLEPVKSAVADHENRLRLVDGLPEDVTALKKTVYDVLTPELNGVKIKMAMYAGAASVLASVGTWLASYAVYHH